MGQTEGFEAFEHRKAGMPGFLIKMQGGRKSILLAFLMFWRELSAYLFFLSSISRAWIP